MNPSPDGGEGEEEEYDEEELRYLQEQQMLQQ